MATIGSENGILDYYNRDVLPALFERLDTAFPEFGWTWNGRQWRAKAENWQRADGKLARHVVCSEPQGFFEDDQWTSWLEYINNRIPPQGTAVELAVAKLAARAGLEPTPDLRPSEPPVAPQPPAVSSALGPIPQAPLSLPTAVPQQPLPPLQLGMPTPTKRPSSASILACFLEESQAALVGPEGERARLYLREQWGIEAQRYSATRLGLYTTPQDMRERLQRRGFDNAQIDATFLTVDARCSGRILLPAYKLNGELATIFARRVGGDSGPVYLHMKGGTIPAVFGMERALAARSSGKSNLYLVRDRLEAVALHVTGWDAVAALGHPSEGTPNNRWETLADHGVEQVTLVAGAHNEGRISVRHAIEEAWHAQRAPQVWLLPSSELPSQHGLLGHCQKHGLKPAQELGSQRVHALRWKAQELVDEYRERLPRDREHVLNEANRFADSLPQRLKDELERHYWPVIRQATKRPEPPAPPKRVVREARPAPRPTKPTPAKIVTVDEQLADFSSHLEYLRERQNAGLRQHTLPSLDALTLGFRGLTLVTGASAVGKSSLVLQMACDALTYNEELCLVYASRQWSKWQLLERIKCRLAGLDWQRLVTSEQIAFSDHERRQWQAAAEQLGVLGRRFHIADQASMQEPNAERIGQCLQQLKRKTGCQQALVVFDELEDWPLPVQERLGVSHDRAHAWWIEQMRASIDSSTCLLATLQTPNETACVPSRLQAAADQILELKQLGDEALGERFKSVPFPKIPLSRWREDLQASHIEPRELLVSKGQVGLGSSSLELAFQTSQFKFQEGIPALRSYTEPYHADGQWNADTYRVSGHVPPPAAGWE